MFIVELFDFLNNLENSWNKSKYWKLKWKRTHKKSPSIGNLGPYFSTSMQFWTNISQVSENSGHKFAEYCAWYCIHRGGIQVSWLVVWDIYQCFHLGFWNNSSFEHYRIKLFKFLNFIGEKFSTFEHYRMKLFKSEFSFWFPIWGCWDKIGRLCWISWGSSWE